MWDSWFTELIPTYIAPARSTISSRTQRMTSRQHMMLSRPGATPARGALIAFSWTISVALCPSPRILPIAWCTPPVTSKASNRIILTPSTVPLGCACIVAYAAPPCSSVTMIPKSILTTSGVGSSCPLGCSTTTGCIPLF